MNKPAFVWFEFDNETVLLWQSLNQPKVQKTFAYQAKLRQLIHDHISQNGNWQTTLDSLKVLDVFLSAVKSDLAGRNIKEHELVAHPEFVKLLMVLCYHVHQVLSAHISQTMSDVAVECYANAVFGRTYAGAMGKKTGGLSETELPVFYQGLAFLIKADNAFGVSVAQSFFVLSVIGARLFGSVERVFYGLDTQGLPTRLAEDSLYWAVHDCIEQMTTLHDDQAKELFAVPIKPADVMNVKVMTDVAKPISAPMPSQTETGTPQTPPPQQTPSPKPSQAPMPSARKQKARASHTPKLFDEVYGDLKQLTLPSDSDERYQKAVMILDKFDAHIDGELTKGKALADISFSQKAIQARNQALQLLSQAVKAGNPSAMTRLAAYLFEGRGVPANTAVATNLIKKSAEMGDFRASKLLSRLYYQGFDAENGGVAMSVEMGEYWLDKAADGGHPEAKKVRAYMRQIEALKSDRQTEMMSDKRYLMWGAVLGVGLLLIVVMLGAFF